MSNEAEVPQRIWIAQPIEFKSLISKGGPAFDNDIEYVPASALEKVWEDAIATARGVAESTANAGPAMGAWKVMHALEAARDAALSVQKEDKDEG